MNSVISRLPVVFLGVAIAIPHTHAGEALFTHTYLAETLPQGAMEVEQWLTQRSDKSQGTYELTQYRTEFEYGVTDHWTLALYANAYSVVAENNNSAASRTHYSAAPGGDGDEVTGGGPVTFGSYVPYFEHLPLPSSKYSESDFESVSLESINQFKSPYKDGYGLASYVEVTYGEKTEELELKVLYQKNLMEDELILALNGILEFEHEEWAGVGSGEKETLLAFTGGVSYRLAAAWRLGMELRNERAYEGAYSLANKYRNYAAWYAGPTLHYGAKDISVTLGYQQQLPYASAYSNAAKVELVGDRVFNYSEKNILRIILGVSF
ncbi:MAG: hypothetical protein RL497_937 [Pseudomonadota bacterium]|jgi:hypothetical protein